MSNYYVFRINYDDRFKMIRNELVSNHLLRQGWGTYGMALDSSYDTFKAGWQAEWEKDLPDERLHYRTESQRGGRLCMPKLRHRKM